MCNALFQVAGVLGIAKKNNLEPVFEPLINHDHRDRFGSTEDIDLYKHFVHQLPPIPEGIQWQAEKQIPWGYHDITLPPGNWNLTGHFQSQRYFDHCIEEVRHYFTMKDEPPQNDYVAVHVRLTDYDDAYHPRLGMEYYGPAMAQFPPGTYFKVFSDDLRAALTMLGDNFLRNNKGDYLDDFREMKRCKSFIIGNSSYSAMAAILGGHPDKKVIAPRPWFGPRYTVITGEDVYGDGWEVINWKEAA